MKETSGTVDMSCARLLSSSFAVVFNRKKKKLERNQGKKGNRDLYFLVLFGVILRQFLEK